MSRQKDTQTLVKVIQKHGGDWLELIPVITGNRAGVVNAGGGKIWVRFQNGVEARVLNTLAPLAKDRHIRVGRLRSSPNVWRVVEVRETYLESSGNNIGAHHTQHEFGGFDMVAVHRKQVMSATLFVSDAAEFKVRVIGGLFPIPGGWAFVNSTAGTTLNPDLDLTAYIPTEGAIYVSIEATSAGALVVNEGTPAESPELLTFEDVAPVPAGNRLIGFVMLYESQPQLLNEHIYLPGLFMTDYAVSDTGYQIDNAPADTPLDADKWGFWDTADEMLKSITQENLIGVLDAIYAAIAHTHSTDDLPQILTADCEILFDSDCEILYDS